MANQLLQPAILILKLFEPLGLINAKAAIFLAPAILTLLGRARPNLNPDKAAVSCCTTPISY